LKVIPLGRYTKEFREELVKLITEERLSWAESALWLSLLTLTLMNWIKAYKAGKFGDVCKTYRPLTELEIKLDRTKKPLVEVKMKREPNN